MRGDHRNAARKVDYVTFMKTWNFVSSVVLVHYLPKSVLINGTAVYRPANTGGGPWR